MEHFYFVYDITTIDYIFLSFFVGNFILASTMIYVTFPRLVKMAGVSFASFAFIALLFHGTVNILSAIFTADHQLMNWTIFFNKHMEIELILLYLNGAAAFLTLIWVVLFHVVVIKRKTT